jgi:hypothetical protein
MLNSSVIVILISAICGCYAYEICIKSDCTGSGTGTGSTIQLDAYTGSEHYSCMVNGVGNCAWGCCTVSTSTSNGHNKGVKIELVSNPSDGLKVTKINMNGDIIENFDSSTSAVSLQTDGCGCVDLVGSGTTNDCLHLDSDWFRLDANGSPACTKSFTSYQSSDKSFTYCMAGCH